MNVTTTHTVPDHVERDPDQMALEHAVGYQKWLVSLQAQGLKPLEEPGIYAMQVNGFWGGQWQVVVHGWAESEPPPGDSTHPTLPVFSDTSSSATG